jgi:hypothetical protein
MLRAGLLRVMGIEQSSENNNDASAADGMLNVFVRLGDVR